MLLLLAFYNLLFGCFLWHLVFRTFKSVFLGAVAHSLDALVKVWVRREHTFPFAVFLVACILFEFLQLLE